VNVAAPFGRAAVSTQIDEPSRKSARTPAPSADHIDHFDHFFNPEHDQRNGDGEEKGKEKRIIVLVGPSNR
jgi:hypothetical protein